MICDLEKNFEADDKSTSKFYKESKLPIIIINYAKYIVLILGIGLTLVTTTLLAFKLKEKRKRSSEEQVEPTASSTNWIENETTPLLLNN